MGYGQSSEGKIGESQVLRMSIFQPLDWHGKLRANSESVVSIKLAKGEFVETIAITRRFRIVSGRCKVPQD